MAISGLYNRKCDIQVKTETQGTAGVSTPSWATVASQVKCRLDMKRGTEIDTGGGRVVKSTHILYMAYRKLTEESYRILIDSEKYNVVLISRGGGTKHHLELILQRVY